MVFVGGDFGDGVGELDCAGGLLDLAAQMAGQGEELSRGQVRRVTPGDLGFDAAELFAQRVDAVGDGGQLFFAEGFHFDGLEILNLELVFAAPGNESGLGDVEFGHQPCIGPAAGAQFDKALDGIVVVHSVLSRRFYCIRPWSAVYHYLTDG